MRFWDSSAIVPLLVTEQSSEPVEGALAEDAAIVAWWATPLECLSALARRERSGGITSEQVAAAVLRLERLRAGWAEVRPSERVRDTAGRVVRTHDLRAADALQLAAAIEAAERAPRELPFVTLDGRLALAAHREGFPVAPSE